MSDLNDDLLNYDIGEDIDEQVLLAADEDDLLLSDEEDEQRAIIKNEAEDWVNSKLKPHEEEVVEPSEEGVAAEKKPDEIVTTSTSCKSEPVQSEPESPSRSAAAAAAAEESDVSTSAAESPVKPCPEKITTDVASTAVGYAHTTKYDEVSSTNKEIEEQIVSQTPAVEESWDDPIEFTEGKLVETNLHAAQSETDLSSDPREDFDDERSERTNIKLSVERDDRADAMSPEKFQLGGRFQSRRGGGRGGGMLMRGGVIGHFPGSRPPVRYPHLNYPQYPHPNENLNPQLGTIPGQYPPPYNHMDAQMGVGRQSNPFAGCNPMQPRMEFRQVGPGGFRPQNPNDFNSYRGGGGGSMRPDFTNGAQYPPRGAFGPNTMRPMYRPDVPQMGPHMRQRMPLQRAPPGGLPPSGPGPYIPQQSHGGMMPVPGGGGMQHPMTIAGGGGHPPMGGNSAQQRPRKVLINPNFKGGVEAATNQLMKDTQFIQAISSHAPHLQSDEELLRQQEEFINKNRIHIEKRRYERSPERNRSRERSYSPPRRSDRDRRGNSRERRAGSRGRNRRAGSREFESRNFPKRRRSDSFERRREKDKVEVEEDEETRAYRLKIEKQKEMREQILRDKEMRRRKAAEGKLIEEKPTTSMPATVGIAIPTATTTEEAPTKLKPIIVTESKIISLRRKPKMGEEEIEEYKSQTAPAAVVQKPKPIQRTIPTAKILPETIKKLPDYAAKESTATSGSATMAVIKPVVKKPAKLSLEINRKHAILDDDELLEEELLADTPSPPSSPKLLSPIDPPLEQLSHATSGGSGGGGVSKFLSSHRRVILKSSKDQNRQTVADSSTMASSSSEQTKKGIFDRLEKRPRNKECRVTD